MFIAGHMPHLPPIPKSDHSIKVPLRRVEPDCRNYNVMSKAAGPPPMPRPVGLLTPVDGTMLSSGAGYSIRCRCTCGVSVGVRLSQYGRTKFSCGSRECRAKVRRDHAWR